MREILLFVIFFFLSFLVSSPSMQIATVDHFDDLYIQMHNFVQGSAFWGLDDKNIYLPLFSPEFKNLCYGIWRI